MAHGIKKILIDKKEELECNNNQQTANGICKSKMALNNLLLDNCCLTSQNLLNQKNSSTTNALASTPTQQSSSLMNNNNSGNKLSLNSSGASMSTSASTTTGTKMGSRRIFTPQFKLQVLESYRNDNDCKGNQRATARKYGIHRRQIQKWLQCENNLRSIIANNPQNVRSNPIKSVPKSSSVAPILSSSSSSSATTTTTTKSSRQRGVINTDKNGATYSCFSLANVKHFKANNNVGSSTKSLSSSYNDYTLSNSGCNATAIETNNKNIVINNSYYYIDNNSHVTSIYSTTDDHPIDLSCHPTKIKSENVARPIPLHPSSTNYKIPFFNFTAGTSTSSSPPQIIDISNSVVKSETTDPIDLSIPNVSHKRKYSTDNSSKDDNKKPIKLFRPYLESNFDNDEKELPTTSDSQKFPIIWSNAYNFYPDHIHHPTSDYHPFLITSSSPSYYSDPTPPTASPNDSGIMMTYQTLLPPSQASPVSGYDSSTSSIYSFNDNEVELSQGSTSPPYTASHYDAPSPSFSSATMSPIASTETKVPLLSSSFIHDLKFKLHALDCYYNDADCKRNEKLVANKLNINCKVVEKWLRQEGDLRTQQKQYHLQILV